MREVITLSVGQAGNQINQEFWKIISKEHGVNADGQCEADLDSQMQMIDVNFTEA